MCERDGISLILDVDQESAKGNLLIGTGSLCVRESLQVAGDDLLAGEMVAFQFCGREDLGHLRRIVFTALIDKDGDELIGRGAGLADSDRENRLVVNLC